jgi:pimeloyl-ACP methyl ester carboxylesterase
VRRAPAALILLLALAALPGSAAASTRVYLPIGGAAAIGAPVPTTTPSATPQPTATSSPAPVATATPSATATAVPPTPTATPDPRGDTVFVFLKGLRSSSNDTTFQPVKSALVARGWSYGQLRDYSYSAGASYACDDTYQDVSTSVGLLAAQIDGIRAANPRARVVLVGHSLGGLVGWLELTGAPSSAVGLITVDSPLIGTGSGKTTLLDGIIGCNFSREAAGLFPATIFLDGLNTNKASVRAQRTAEAGAISAVGARLTTVGSDDDCVYLPSLCSILGVFSDDRETQYVYGYERRLRAGGEQFLWPPPSHAAVINGDAAWLAEMVEWAAAPR